MNGERIEWNSYERKKFTDFSISKTKIEFKDKVEIILHIPHPSE